MDTPTLAKFDTKLYEEDFHAWCVDQGSRLRARVKSGAHDDLDYDNLAEEIEGLARSDRRAIKSRMRVLLTHLLKWRHQADRRSDGWESTIRNARAEIADLLEDSPSLVTYTHEMIAKTYSAAVRDAAAETRLSRATFPQECPFAEADVLDTDFLPSD